MGQNYRFRLLFCVHAHMLITTVKTNKAKLNLFGWYICKQNEGGWRDDLANKSVALL